MKNTIIENLNSGVRVEGEGNFAKIFKNEKIACNNEVGIIVRNLASPDIYENFIYDNIDQGVLICSNSNAIIKHNKIYRNIKANLAYGGLLSELTIIEENQIYSSRCEGIFCFRVNEGATIRNNEVYDNNDGIVLMNSSVTITENTIFANARSGVLVGKNCFPILVNNKIIDNKFLGIYYQEKVQGEIKDNELTENISQVYLAKDSQKVLAAIKESNTIQGRSDVKSFCSLF